MSTLSPSKDLTVQQAAISEQKILELMKARRFFLAKNHKLERKDFKLAFDLQEKLSSFYKKQAEDATSNILSFEKKFGVSHAELEKNQTISQCSFYTGGLEVVKVISCSHLLSFAPETAHEVEKDLHRILFGEPDPDNTTPAQARERNAITGDLSKKVSADMVEIHSLSCVILYATKFGPTWEKGFDFLTQKVGDLIKCSHGLAYLFYKHEMYHYEKNSCTSWGNNYDKYDDEIRPQRMITSLTSVKDHITVNRYMPHGLLCESKGDKPVINFHRNQGYNDPVLIPILV